METTFKKSQLLFFAILLLGHLANAQNQNNNRIRSEQQSMERSREEFRMGQRIEMFAKRLSLTYEQLDKVKSIERLNLEEERRLRERASVGNNLKGSSGNFGRQGINPSVEQRSLNYDFLKLRKETDDKIDELLTENQRLKFAEIRKRELKIMEDRMNGIRPGNQQMNTPGKNKKEKAQGVKNAKQQVPKKQ